MDLAPVLDRYDSLPLECDGMTRVISCILNEQRVSHKCFVGVIQFKDRSFSPHFWIEAGDYIIDYRARMWMGKEADHGVFRKADSDIVYEGKSIVLNTPDFVFKILTER